MSLASMMLRGLAYTASLPPAGLCNAAGRGLGKLAHGLDSRHRIIMRENLAASFPDKDDKWVRDTARACYAHIGQVASEIPRLLRYSPEQLMARTRFHGHDVYYRAMAKGKGLLLLTGHIGNWEWASVVSGIVAGPCCVVARPLDWKPADELVNRWRTKTGHIVAPKAGSARRILSWLRREKKPVGVLLDQNVDWYDGVWVDFFGRPACTNKGLALLAMSTGAPVLPFYSFRAPDGSFDVYVDPEIPLVKTGDKTQDVWDNTQNYTKALERIIRRRPEQWFWLHQRWKTKPYHRWPRETD